MSISTPDTEIRKTGHTSQHTVINLWLIIGLTSATKVLCCNFFLAFIILTRAASIVDQVKEQTNYATM